MHLRNINLGDKAYCPHMMSITRELLCVFGVEVRSIIVVYVRVMYKRQIMRHRHCILALGCNQSENVATLNDHVASLCHLICLPIIILPPARPDLEITLQQIHIDIQIVLISFTLFRNVDRKRRIFRVRPFLSPFPPIEHKSRQKRLLILAD